MVMPGYRFIKNDGYYAAVISWDFFRIRLSDLMVAVLKANLIWLVPSLHS